MNGTRLFCELSFYFMGAIRRKLILFGSPKYFLKLLAEHFIRFIYCLKRNLILALHIRPFLNIAY